MSLLKYSNSIEKTIHENSDLYIDSFMKKIQGTLRTFDTRSEIQNDSIKFKRIVKSLALSGKNKIEGMKLVREGLIKIERINSKRIRIFWEVKLDTLLFISILIGLVIGLISGFASSLIAFSTIIGLLFSSITYFIGCSIVKSKIDEIVAAAM
jgi:hypothetical protein